MNHLQDAMFYHIYPLGFCGALYENDFYSEPVLRFEEINEEWIIHIKELGMNAVYLGPIFESKYHGYDTADYFRIDRRLGDEDCFKRLVERLHHHGIKVVLDGVFHHVGRDFWAFQDVCRNGQNSPYKDWFYLDFNQRSPYQDNFRYEPWEGHYELVKLNLQNHDTKMHLLEAVSYWIHQLHIDGIRLDVAYSLDTHFLQALNQHCTSIKNDFWLIGEIIHGDYRRIANPTMLQSTTNYECYKGLYSSHNDKNYFELAHSLNREFGSGGMYRDLPLYNFVDNHDVDRIASKLNKASHLYPLYISLFTIPGVPAIYYGSEWGMEGKKQGGCDSHLRPKIDIQSMQHMSNHKDLLPLIQKLSSIRNNHPVLRYGEYKQVLVKNEQLAYARTTGEDTLIVMLNIGDQSAHMEIELPRSGVTLIDILNEGQEFYTHSNKISIEVHPSWGRILRVISL